MTLIPSTEPGDTSPDGLPPVPTTDSTVSAADPTAAAATSNGLDTEPTAPVEPATPSRKRRWIAVAGLAGLVAVGAGTAYAIADGGGDAADDAAPVTLRAVTAEQRDLIEYTDLSGTLGYADVRSVTAVGGMGGTTTGTVTAVIDDGETVERGSTLYEIDALPVVVFYGEVPLYRTLAEGDEGDDVALLEANLASLGYHIEEPDDDGDEVDTGFTVDGDFDAATADAVRRWQADLGVEETGRLDPRDVVVVPGPAVAAGVQVELGSVVAAGTPVLDLNVTSTVDAFHADHAGELQLEATSGPVATGDVLYVVDDLPITAVVTDETFERDLSEGVDDGDDVRVLEEMLVALGHDARGDLIPDDEFDEITTEAVEAWEEDLQDTWDEVDVDGIVSVSEITVVDDGTSIGAVTPRDGELVATGSELFTWRSDDGVRIVTTSIEVADQDRLTEGSEVDVEFPDGAVVVGTVTDMATSSTLDPTNPDAEARLAVEIALAEIPESAAGFNELDVEVNVVENLAAGATVVPASALLVTADGGYAVEAVDGSTTSYVAVEVGMFADGFVEVTGIEPGVAVVVPS